MIKNIYYDWYDGDDYNDAFGQISYHDEYDVKLDVHIADNPSDCVINGCGYALRYIGQDEIDENGAVNPLSVPY